jgi:aryl-alcohol dehydrogenase-like predicted oxidoreductase
MNIDGLHRRLGRTGSTVTAVGLGYSSMSGLTGASKNDDVTAATIRAAEHASI